jgi:hypothetical protein
MSYLRDKTVLQGLGMMKYDEVYQMTLVDGLLYEVEACERDNEQAPAPSMRVPSAVPPSDVERVSVPMQRTPLRKKSHSDSFSDTVTPDANLRSAERRRIRSSSQDDSVASQVVIVSQQHKKTQRLTKVT